jgi:PhzF family phenazine biosynthesis protein
MQKIAMENNLAETAFYVKQGDDFRIRWFTPAAEVDLCGHATLAAAHVLFYHRSYKKSEVRFHSRSGVLGVTQENDLLTPGLSGRRFQRGRIIWRARVGIRSASNQSV